jgi:hypothetical protein
MSILLASRETLQSIRLIIGHHYLKAYQQLWKMHFPHLKSLDLVLFSSIPIQMTEFILAHNDTLETLSTGYPTGVLGTSARGSNFATIEDSSIHLTSSSLPKLKSFSGPISDFCHMVTARMKCIGNTLQELRVAPSGPGEIPELQIRQFLNTMLLEGFPLMSRASIRVLSIGLGKTSERNNTAEFYTDVIRDCSKHFGHSLEVWFDSISFPMKAEKLGPLFGLFSKLRIIHIHASAIGKGAKLDDSTGMDLISEYVLKLALYCTLLEEVIVTSELRDFRRMIGRGENGPYIRGN